ncbi:MAG: hypothetical protein DI498_03055 [Paracoccus denitrificans]|nr:MAG: hypothetical protein DI498_03055 [Paracoccus denitrificans]PZO85513.1 MAG: hypothetical protein DI633_03055 [Paracoccus denitrificans]
MTTKPTTAAVVLAAGHSRRWGPGNKLLAFWQGAPMASAAARLLRDTPADWRAVVRRDPDVAALFPATDKLTPNGEDQSASLRRAAQYAADLNADRVVILLADMPCVSVATVTRVMSATTPDLAACVAYPDDRSGPPACFPRGLFSQLMSVTGDQGARFLLKSAVRVVAPSSELIDFDTPDDLSLPPAQ